MIQRTRLPWKRTSPHHAQIHFPPLTGQEALLVVNLLDRVIAALWRTHGDAMADLLACCDPDAALPNDPDDSPLPDVIPEPNEDDPF
jgi:hypothetical protein